MSFADHTVKTKPRLLTVTESCRYYPRITISGAWLRDWGFSVGDRVFLMHIAAGETLIRVGTRFDDSDIAKYCHQTCVLTQRLIRDSESYCLSRSQRDCPEIIITGAWLRDWGFAIGDRISLTLTEEDHVLMKIAMPRSEWREILRKQKLEKQAAIANAMLQRHKAIHPNLYPDEAPRPTRKRAAAAKPAKPVQPSNPWQPYTKTTLPLQHVQLTLLSPVS